MRGINNYLGMVGEMVSGSINPEEQNQAREKEAEKWRREQEREQQKEQTRLLREQQAQQAERQKSLQTSALKPFSETNPNDPVSGVPENKQMDILLHKYDNNNRQPTDYLGGTMSRDKQNEYINTWKNRIRQHTPEMRAILLQQNMNHYPDIRKQVEDAKREYGQWFPQNVRNLELKINDPDRPSGKTQTLDYRPLHHNAPAISNAVQNTNKPAHLDRASTPLIQTKATAKPKNRSEKLSFKPSITGWEQTVWYTEKTTVALPENPTSQPVN